MAAMQERDWPIGTTRRDFSYFAMRLAAECDAPDITHGFMAAERFYHHFHHQDMEEYEMDLYRPIVRDFVERVLALE